MCARHAQEHPDSLQTVLDIVVAHQGAPAAARLVGRLLAALVEPSPEAFRPLLRRIAVLESAPPPLCFQSDTPLCPKPHQRPENHEVSALSRAHQGKAKDCSTTMQAYKACDRTRVRI